jgi:hypothetical protein
MANTPRRTDATVLEPYRVTLAYRYADLRKHQGNCPRTVVVSARDAADAIDQARLLVPHTFGITRVVPSVSNADLSTSPDWVPPVAPTRGPTSRRRL